jgi:3-methyladenine DNA glycosylase AlkD
MLMISDIAVMDELKALGTEQNRKLLKRRGVGENVYGVSYADLKKLVKKMKVNHDLAVQLWATGNHDARTLALMIADPGAATPELLESWVGDIHDYVMSDALGTYVSKTPHARQMMERWITSDDEWIGATGWNVLAGLATNNTALPDDYFEGYLDIIQRDLHTAKNRIRHSMNSALIAIGVRNSHLENVAVSTATRIGKVVVDHGQTDCKTPDAIAYIQKVKARRN